VKEFEIVDGFPILDEWEHTGGSQSGEKKYQIDFRVPLKGINRKLISTTLLNVCNMFSTLYFLQMVVTVKSDSIQVPGKSARQLYKTIES